MPAADSPKSANPPSATRERFPGQVKFLVCVDRRPQSRVAVRYACRRAKNTGGAVSLLHVIEPVEFQHWIAVEDVMEKERRGDAEQLLQDLSSEVNEWAGIVPEVVLREGDIGEEILAQVEEDPDIDVLVVGAAAPSDTGFSLITFLAGKLVGRLAIPLFIVPGNLSDERIVSMT